MRYLIEDESGQTEHASTYEDALVKAKKAALELSDVGSQGEVYVYHLIGRVSVTRKAEFKVESAE